MSKVDESKVVIIGADAGRSFGMSVLRPHDPMSLVNPRLHDVRQLAAEVALELLRDTLVSWMSSGYTPVVAAERFVNLGGGNRTALDETSVYIGQLKQITADLDVVVHFQNTSDVKKAANNTVLRQFQLYTSARELRLPDANDANDATRHAFWRFIMDYPHLYDNARKSIGI